MGKTAQIYDLKVQDKQGFLIVASDREGIKEHEKAIKDIYNLISGKKKNPTNKKNEYYCKYLFRR